MIIAVTEKGKTMSDYISRQDAIDALSRGEGCGNICRRSIERIPSADVTDNHVGNIELTKKEAHALAEFVDMNLIPTIRNDTDIDSMEWLKCMIHAYEKLCKFSGYVGLTEFGRGEQE